MGIFKDENGRSYGDWTRRGQGRTSEHANDIVTTGDEKKWYDQTFWIVFFLIVLWPVGLVMMWRGACTWHVAVKVIVTIARASFSLMKARHRPSRWRAFPILYAFCPCSAPWLRASY